MEQLEQGDQLRKDRLARRLRERAALAERVSDRAGAADCLARLRHRDHIQQDNEAIASIYRNLGTSAAEQLVSRALAELSLQMAGLQMRLRCRQIAELPRQLRKTQGMAESLGMITMARVAEDARACLERGEDTAFSAVWARLMRVAERCLSSGNMGADAPGL